jgi:hypothetical protein
VIASSSIATAAAIAIASSSSSSLFSSSASSLSPAAGSELGLRVDEWLLLDWSGSYDDSEADSNQNELLFDWSCLKISPSYRSSCDGSLVITPSSSSSSSQVALRVNSSSLAPGLGVKVTEGDVFKFMLRARSSQSGDDRQCERMFDVVILASASPLLRLSVLGGSASPSSSLSSSSSIIKINPTSKLKVRGPLT